MLKQILLSAVIIASTFLQTQSSKAYAEGNYKFFYSNQCSECVDILSYVTSDDKAISLNIEFVNVSKTDEEMTRAKTTCNIYTFDLSLGYFYVDSMCMTGRDAILAKIKELAAAQPDITVDPSTVDSTTNNDNTNDTSTSTEPSNEEQKSSTPTNNQSTQSLIQIPELTFTEGLIMLIAPALFVLIAYMLIKRLKL